MNENSNKNKDAIRDYMSQLVAKRDAMSKLRSLIYNVMTVEPYQILVEKYSNIVEDCIKAVDIPIAQPALTNQMVVGSKISTITPSRYYRYTRFSVFK